MTYENDPVYQWYQKQREKAKKLAAELAYAEENGASYDELARLREELERARYVGD